MIVERDGSVREPCHFGDNLGEGSMITERNAELCLAKNVVDLMKWAETLRRRKLFLVRRYRIPPSSAGEENVEEN